MTIEDSSGQDEQTQFPEEFDGTTNPAPVSDPFPGVQYDDTKLSRTPVVPEEASRSSRLAARLIDGVVVVIPWIIASFSANGLLATLFGFSVIAVTVYQFILLSREGQTIGKRTMNIRIVKNDSGEIGGFVTNVLLREIVNTILCLVPLYYIADALFIFRDDQRCIHDLIAKTKIVRD